MHAPANRELRGGRMPPVTRAVFAVAERPPKPITSSQDQLRPEPAATVLIVNHFLPDHAFEGRGSGSSGLGRPAASFASPPEFMRAATRRRQQGSGTIVIASGHASSH